MVTQVLSIDSRKKREKRERDKQTDVGRLEWLEGNARKGAQYYSAACVDVWIGNI